MQATRSAISPTGMTGTPASPTSIAAGANNTATFAIATVGVASANVKFDAVCRVIIGTSAPTTQPAVQWQVCYDGTNFVNYGGAQQVPITATSISYDYPLDSVPAGVVAVAVVVTNGATNAITAWAEGNATQYS